jgi:hypothetical protein
MLSVEKCMEILNAKGKKYTQEQAKAINKFLWKLAEMYFNNCILKKPNSYEESSHNGKSK